MRENSRRGASRLARAADRPADRAPGRGANRAAGRGADRLTGRGSSRTAGARGATGWQPGPNGGPGGPDGRPAGAPDVARLTRIIEPVLHAMDVDLEAVKIGTAGRRRVLRIIVDADGGIGLDEIAEVSREVSARLDSKNAMGDAPYTLEVSSPGVDRPLTHPRHWRRATGRLVVVPIEGHDGPARVTAADDHGVTLEISGEQRSFGYGELGPGRVQVEFAKLDESGDARDRGDHGADEEGPDGH